MGVVVEVVLGVLVFVRVRNCSSQHQAEVESANAGTPLTAAAVLEVWVAAAAAVVELAVELVLQVNLGIFERQEAYRQAEAIYLGHFHLPQDHQSSVEVVVVAAAAAICHKTKSLLVS